MVREFGSKFSILSGLNELKDTIIHKSNFKFEKELIIYNKDIAEKFKIMIIHLKRISKPTSLFVRCFSTLCENGRDGDIPNHFFHLLNFTCIDFKCKFC